jgi:DNA-binding beta-propeller fold protein YncE
MKTFCSRTRWISAILPGFMVLCSIVPALASATQVRPVFTLSNFSGSIPYNNVRLAVDRSRGEVFVLDLHDCDIRVFNGVGMEVYRTGSYRVLGFPLDLALRDDGGIDLLVRDGDRRTVHRCDYRGEPVSVVEFTGVPEGFSDMRPDRILWKGGHLYVVDTDSLRVAVYDGGGRYERGYMLADVLEPAEQQDRGNAENAMFGFTVDREGRLFFTIPTLFSVYRVSVDGRVETFGEAGSSPGKFSIVSGIAVDEDGYIYLSDRNRSVVMIYGPDLKFRYEFGYRGLGPGGLIVPRDLDVDGTGKVYVAQMGSRGIKAFRVSLAQSE